MVQQRYESANEFHALFEQASTVRALGREQKAEGEVWFKKPGKMRWNYYYPNKDEIVSDGEKFWYYSSEDKQVVESTLKGVVDSPTTTTLLQGLGSIKDLFDARFPASGSKDEKGRYVVELEPKNTGRDETGRFAIAVNPDTWLAEVVYLYDPFGNTTTITFKDIKLNNGIAESLFAFKVPKGAEVIKAPPAAVR
jgi:outer membrane lipoprotein carrier protein